MSQRFLPNDYETHVNLLNIYLTEWMHRNTFLWKQTFKFFFATLIIILLPNISEPIGIDLPNLPLDLFPALGLVLSVAFLYLTIGYAKRLEASRLSFQKIMHTIPNEFQRESISNIPFGKLFDKSLAIIISFLLFIILIALAILMLIL